jgi:hypothetical protein
MLSNATSVLCCLLIFVFYVSNLLDLWMLGVLVILISSAKALEAPALFSQIQEISPGGRLQLLNAGVDISKRSSRIIAPLVVTFTSSLVSSVNVFLVIACSSLISLLSNARLYVINNASQINRPQSTIQQDLKEAVILAGRMPRLRGIIFIDMAYSFAYQAVLMVILPKHLLAIGANGEVRYAVALSALACGAVIGALISSFAARLNKLNVIYYSKLAGLLLLVTLPYLTGGSNALTVVSSLVGVCLSFERVAIDSFIQASVPSQMIGKTYAFWRTLVEFSGSLALGIAGLLLNTFFSNHWAVLFCGASILAITAIFFSTRSSA